MELKNKLAVLEHDRGGKKSHLVSEVIGKKKVAASPQKKRRRVQRDPSVG